MAVHSRLATLLLALGVAAALPGQAEARKTLPATYLSAGAEIEPPFGFTTMCQTAQPFCGADRPYGETGAAILPLPAVTFGAARCGFAGERRWSSALIEPREFLLPATIVSAVAQLPVSLTVQVASLAVVAASPAPSCLITGGLVATPLRREAQSASVEPTGPAHGGDLKLLKTINWHVNAQTRQVSDEALYHIPEYWTRSGSGSDAAGDCEDMAIEKRARLVSAGFPADKLAFAVVFSHATGLHTILIARTDAGDLILDNRRNGIVAWSRSRYRWLAIQSMDDPAHWHAVRPAAT